MTSVGQTFYVYGGALAALLDLSVQHLLLFVTFCFGAGFVWFVLLVVFLFVFV